MGCSQARRDRAELLRLAAVEHRELTMRSSMVRDLVGVGSAVPRVLASGGGSGSPLKQLSSPPSPPALDDAATLASCDEHLSATRLQRAWRRRTDSRAAQLLHALPSVAGSIAARADMLLLGLLAGPVATGLYAAAYRFVNGLDAVAMAVANGLMMVFRV